MSNIIAFLTATDRAARALEMAFADYNAGESEADRVEALTRILRQAICAETGAIRTRAARWLAEVYNVQIAA